MIFQICFVLGLSSIVFIKTAQQCTANFIYHVVLKMEKILNLFGYINT